VRASTHISSPSIGSEIEAPRVEEVGLLAKETIADAYIFVDLENGDDATGTFSFNFDYRYNRPFKTLAGVNECARNLKLMVGDMVSITIKVIVSGEIYLP